MQQEYGLNSKLAIRIAACLMLMVLSAACGLLPDRADTGTAQTSTATQAHEPEAAVATSADQVALAPAGTDSADPATTEPLAPPPEQAAREEPANPPDAEPAPAAAIMDLDGLETSLRKTKAIGLFTKLELKSQVNELLDDVENYHEAKSGLSLSQLEEHFNLLVMKLLVLLENEDPQLHREIAQARPVLWTALADPVQFSTIKGP